MDWIKSIIIMNPVGYRRTPPKALEQNNKFLHKLLLLIGVLLLLWFREVNKVTNFCCFFSFNQNPLSPLFSLLLLRILHLNNNLFIFFSATSDSSFCRQTWMLFHLSELCVESVLNTPGLESIMGFLGFVHFLRKTNQNPNFHRLWA